MHSSLHFIAISFGINAFIYPESGGDLSPVPLVRVAWRLIFQTIIVIQALSPQSHPEQKLVSFRWFLELQMSYSLNYK